MFLFFLAVPLFLLYLVTISPTVYWHDSGEFITAAWGLGITHPAGSPLYLSLAKWATLFPLGSIAFRVNLLSALTAALAITLLLDLSWVLLSRFLRAERLPGRYLVFAAYLPGLLLGVSASIWREATIAEVYAAKILFFLLILRFLFEEQPGYRRVALFLLGLGAGIHITLLFYLPAALFVALSGTDKGKRIREGGILLLCLIMGLSIYLYLPVRSLTTPYYNWGEPDTLKQFLIHVADRKDKAYYQGIYWTPWKFSDYGLFLLGNFTLPLALLGFIGAYLTLCDHRRIGIFLVLLFVPDVLFFIRYWDTPSAYLSSFAVFALWISFALAKALSLFYRTAILRGVLSSEWVFRSATCIGAAALVGVLLWDLPERSLRDHRFPEEVYTEFFRQLKPTSIFFSQLYYFPMSYLQQVEGARPDVSLVLTSDVYEPAYFTRVTQRRFPRLRLPPQGVRHAKDMPALISLNTDRPIYWEPDIRTDRKMLKHLLPQGFFYEIRAEGVDPSAVLEEHFSKLKKVYRYVMDLAPTPYDEYAVILRLTLNDLGVYFSSIGMPEEALKMFRLILAKYPDSSVALRNSGDAYFRMGRYAEAEAMLRVALERSWDPAAQIVLGKVYLLRRHFAQAEEMFRSVLRKEDPLGEAQFEKRQEALLGEAQFGLALSLEGQGRRGEARLAWRNAVALLGRVGDEELVNEARGKLNALVQAGE